MIVLKDISKTYILKSGDVCALDEVSITLPDKGMVFLLGKSGSGKTTLLNILGGLDNYTSGEIVVDGVSFADYKSKDYDEYRNRYVGFVFQDYSLIDNFDVEYNIALALRLQHQKSIKEKVDKVLEEVGLKGYNKRKIDELSGGQKQRVAIARALIKSPSVILADEPTGNLDSTTAEEIFELLKRLSKDRLVVVVSHDKDSAEKYADRIVSLKDGKIVDDTDACEITQQQKEHRNNDNAKKKSSGNMPFDGILSYALCNLRSKIIRVIASIVCFILVLGLFNLAYSSSLYNIYDRICESLKENDTCAVFSRLGDDLLKYDFLDDNFGGEGISIYEDRNFGDLCAGEHSVADEYHCYYSDDIMASMTISDGISDRYGWSVVAGRLPQNALEVCLTKYMAESMLYLAPEFWQREGVLTIDDFIGRCFGQTIKFDIVGVVDTKISSKYDVFKSNDAKFEGELFTEFQSYMRDCSHKTVLCHQTYYDDIYLPLSNQLTYISKNAYMNFPVARKAYYVDALELLPEDIAVMGNIDGDGVVVSSVDFRDIVKSEGYAELLVDNSLQTYKSIIESNVIETYFYYDYDKDLRTSNCNYARKMRIVGVFEQEIIYSDASIFVTDGIAKEMKDNISCLNAIVFDKTQEKAIKKAIDLSYLRLGDNNKVLLYNSDDTSIILKEYVTAQDLKDIAYGATAIFVLVVVVLMLNYFLSTIKDKTKEIGVLRAIGVKNSNIMAIFLTEALIISLLSYVISIPFAILVGNWMEVQISAGLTVAAGEIVKIILVGAKSCLVTFAVCIAVTLIGTIPPFVKLARLKPMEIIRK